MGAIADDAQIELVRKESGRLQANGCLALYTCVWHVGIHVHVVCVCVCVGTHFVHRAPLFIVQ